MGFGWGGLTRTISYAPEAPTPAPTPAVDPARIAEAVRYNETRGVQDPYAFRRPSGAGDYANGAYQVRDAELATYAPRYLGRAVTPQQFLASPQMQDQYMRAKAEALAKRGLTPEQILAAHRGGASDLTPEGLASLVSRNKGYVDAGMQVYNNPASPPGPAPRSFKDLTENTP
ncbi:MAG: hypothetical protein KGL39_48935 [Patescibacteria group bacterium]|nr:hypothetical protein [Patescibacteria group bacterium]